MAKSPWVRPMFDAIAPRYDLLNRLISLGMDVGWRRRAVRAALGDRPAIVLDVGAGTGDLAFELQRQAVHPCRVIALDFARAMLRVAVGRAAQARAPVLWPVAGDALHAPLPDAAVDAVITAFVLRNLDDLALAWQSFARVLKPGGRLVVLEMTPVRTPVFRTIFWLYFHRWVPLLGRLLSGHRSAYAWLPRSVDAFPSAVAIAAQLQSAGFADVQFQRMGFGTVALHVARKPELARA